MQKSVSSLCLIIFLLLLFVTGKELYGQSLLRQKKISLEKDTVYLDSLTIIPGTLQLKTQTRILDTSDFYSEDFKAYIIIKHPVKDSAEITYRVFNENLSKEYAHKRYDYFEPDSKGNKNPFSYTINNNSRDIFDTDGLNKSGSISRGVNFGNNQDLSVNSNLNLQLSGRITDKIYVIASVTDDNIPIQPDGNTQQLQDFDQVFIKVYDDKSSLTAGDFWMKRPTGYFLVYNKRGQGASFTTKIGNEKNPGNGIFETRASAALSKGKFSRNVIQGIEGNQGPYRLRGAENETFIIVLAGTEQVYIDGQLLKRGQENDYVIDYNTSEITFTPNRLITKDRRIIVEFQYSDKNYARSIIENTNTWKSEKMNLFLNIYSEQDSKNQPLQQDLSAENKALLNSVGDSLHLAVAPSVDSVGYDDNLVLYAMVDSLGYDSVFVFSTAPDSAFYKLQFSYVGEGKGNYVQDQFTALGRTFRWVAPDTIASVIYKQGNYDPVVVLISPKKKQMISAGVEYKFGKNTKAWVEGAFSNFDQNTFSTINNEDDQGYAVKIGMENKLPVNAKKKVSYVTTRFNLETVSQNFRQIERFRAVEFERNWNILNKVITKDQYIADAEIALSQDKTGRIAYGFNSFLAGSDYQGMLHRVNGNLSKNGWNSTLTGSYLDSKGFSKTSFLRHKAFISKALPFVVVGFRDEHERNEFYYNNSDSMLRNSYQFYDWEAFIQSPDTTKSRYTLFYRERTDWLSDTNKLTKAARGTQYGFTFDLMKNPKNMLRGKFAYRDLKILDTALTAQNPDKTLLSRLEYDLKAFKNAVSLSTFYEIGTGQELKKEFLYLEVPAGQGIYTWIDYNENGIKDLNEFEIAAFPDQATYIRAFTPSSEYVRTYTNQFSQSINLNPSTIWKNKKGIRKILALVSSQTAFRVERKTNSEDELNRFNPFLKEISDSSLLTLNSSFRNTVFINRTGSVFGLDYTYQDVNGKSLLTNGFDSRSNTFHLIKARWNVTPEYGLVTEAESGVKGNASDFLNGRNYSLRFYKVSPKFSWQPNTQFRWVFSYKYTEKKNSEDYGGESVFMNDLGTELKYNVVNKGSFLANLNYIMIKYNGLTNSSLAFEMLDALKPGTNFTWSASWQRNLSKNMQLNLNYTGRKTEGVRSIHTGGVQVRAFF